MSLESERPDEPGEPPTPTTGPAHPGEPADVAEPVDPAEPVEEHEPAPPVEERRYPSTVGGAVYLLVLVAAATGVAIVSAHEWRTGVRVISGALAAAAVARVVLPQRDAGMLAVRHRSIDVLLLAGVAAALFFLAGDIPDQPS